MNWSDYVCDGQMSIFDLEMTRNQSFNPLEALALCGTGFEKGMERVKSYFERQHSFAEKVKYLKSEYGTGGFGSPVKKPCYICGMDTFSAGSNNVKYSYYDENVVKHDSTCSWEQLARTIIDMIAQGKYLEG